MEERIEALCQTFRPDVLLSGGLFISPSGIERLRKKHGFVMGYLMGYNHLLDGITALSFRGADFLIVHDSYLIPILKGSRYGKVPHVFFMLCMANPQEHRPVRLSEQDCHDFGAEVAFIGGAGENRVEALRYLTRYDLRIWGGRDWSKIPELAQCFCDEPVYGLKKTKIYNAAKIVLNIEDDEKQINAISNRIPEVLLCGGFVITDWRRDLEKTQLVEGESLVTYRTLDELVDKVGFYLQHPEERKRISENGRRTVLNSLTYSHVAGPLIRQVEAVVKAKRSQA